MVPGEKTFCGYRTSTLCKGFAWNDILLSCLLAGLLLIGLVTRFVDRSIQLTIPGLGEVTVDVKVVSIIMLILTLPCFAMGVILLKGTTQKRVGFLKAWLIYEMFGLVCLIPAIVLALMTFWNTLNQKNLIIPIGLLSIACIPLVVFAIYVVNTHRKEIKARVIRTPV